MGSIAGLRGTGDWGTDERPKNFRELILWRDPNGQTPLTALMSKMRKETVNDPEFNWWEEEQKAIRIQMGAAATTGVAGQSLTINTAADVDFSGLDVVAGDLLMVEATPAAAALFGYELIEVSSNPTASTAITVNRGAANTGANTGTIASGTYLLKIGNAFEEGTTSPKATSRNPTKFTNYTQIFKTTYNLTNTARATYARTGDAESNDKKRKAFDHAAAMEYAAMWGHPYETTGTDGKPKRYTGGLWNYLTANYDATNKPTVKVWTTTAIDEDDILDATYGMWDFNVPESGSERLVLAGNGFLNYLNKIANSSASTRINYDKTIKYFGMELERWRLPQGTLYVRTHPLMNTHSLYKNGAFILNPPGIRYRPLQGRDTKFMDNIQANDADQKKGQWIGEVGFEFHHLRSMRYLGIHV